uniref:Uncharacterized protein n=1 Tax=Xenopus tropicalis TaxID=8364 RepID=A0A803KCH4_XENTR
MSLAHTCHMPCPIPAMLIDVPAPYLPCLYMSLPHTCHAYRCPCPIPAMLIDVPAPYLPSCIMCTVQVKFAQWQYPIASNKMLAFKQVTSKFYMLIGCLIVPQMSGYVFTHALIIYVPLWITSTVIYSSFLWFHSSEF